MPDNQTEAGASAEGGPSEIRATGVHPPSTKRKRDEQDDEDMAVGAPAKGKMRESFGEEVSAEPSTGITARVQESISGGSTTEKERSDGPITSDDWDPDLAESYALGAQWEAMQDAGINVLKLDKDYGACIGSFKSALAVLPNDHPNRLDALNLVIKALGIQFDRTGDMVDLEERIYYQREFLSVCPIGHPDRVETLNHLGVGLYTRFEKTGNTADLEEFIRHHQALILLPIGDEYRMGALNNIGAGLDVRFRLTKNVADLGESIRHYREALALCPIDHSTRASMLKNLGSGLDQLFEERGNVADLEESIRYHRESLALRPIGHPDCAKDLDSLGDRLNKLFTQTGNLADLEESIVYYKGTLALRPISDPYRVETLSKLGVGCAGRFRRTEDMTDLEESIRHFREALALCPIGHPGRVSTLSNLGNAFHQLFGKTGNMADLEESIRYHQETLALDPIGPVDRASTLSNLGDMLYTRFGRTEDMADLEESIRHHQEALTLRVIDHPDRASALIKLGVGLNARIERMGNLGDLEGSIHHHQEALTLFPMGHIGRELTLYSLISALNKRFDRTGNMADLEETIRHNREILILRPIGHPDRASTLHTFGNGLHRWFGQTGRMADLEESIRHHREALTLRPIGHPDHASTLNSLGIGLTRRFDWSGNLADQDESIRHHREALTLCPIGHVDRASALDHLGTALETRFGRTGNMDDLEEGIHHHRESLTLCPIGHADRASILNNLGNGLHERFGRTRNMVDLEESIRHREETLTLSPIGDPDRASSLNNLGTGLATRFEQTGNIADLEKSIRYRREALALCPVGHPDRKSSLSNLGTGLIMRFKQKGQAADLEEGIQHYTDIASQTTSKVSDRIAAARNWIHAARENGLESLGEAYSTYMDLNDRSLLLSASSVPESHTHMANLHSNGVGLTEDATSYAIKTHRLGEAVEIAERGRALLFTQLGNYRTPLNDLEVVSEDLANQFRALSTALDHSTTSLPGRTSTFPTSGDEVARRQQMAADWDRTLQEIRQLDGFGDFLGVTPYAKLQQAAADGPVILVNIGRNDSYALIISASGDPLSVPLPEATLLVIVRLVGRLTECIRGDADGPKTNQRLTEILRELWTTIVAPIVFQLETALCLRAGSRIWWMPTSWAWWLPLHAAGPYKSGERNLPDRYISSYTTTLSSLIRSRARYHPAKRVSGPRMLVIAQAEAEGQDPLPNVGAEVAVIRKLGTEATILEAEDCTKDAVLAGLKDMAWAHFSCHGHQPRREPFKAHFSLRTAVAPLTLLDIIQNDLPHAELAVLSACHSASADFSTPNEAVNLAAGIMFAGFRGAVGTMWAMDDQDGPVMTKYFYEYMFRNGPEAVDCRDAAKAMVMGVRELRRCEVPLARWINFVHYGI
ncbi:hypothetical protein FRB93_006136 [Tulasnella sp. JGI-2019a]|nr:hypothetical protein FRB93_006136 [Tulasnella sp. JGI-2019a]